METKCSKCSYEWNTSSISALVTCPSCQLKTNREAGANALVLEKENQSQSSKVGVSVEDRIEENEIRLKELIESNNVLEKENRDNEIANARIDHTAIMSGISMGLPQEKNKEQQANEIASQLLQDIGGIPAPTTQ